MREPQAQAPEWLLAWLPDWVQPWVLWLLTPPVITTLVLGSVLLFVASVIAVPWFIVRVPPDHFTRPWQRGLWFVRLRLWQRVAILLAKNLAGMVLVVVGLAMLVLPGQGLITILAGSILLDLPGKRRLERRVLGWPPLFNTLNRLRQRAGKAPLELSAKEKAS